MCFSKALKFSNIPEVLIELVYFFKCPVNTLHLAQRIGHQVILSLSSPFSLAVNFLLLLFFNLRYLWGPQMVIIKCPQWLTEASPLRADLANIALGCISCVSRRDVELSYSISLHSHTQTIYLCPCPCPTASGVRI